MCRYSYHNFNPSEYLLSLLKTKENPQDTFFFLLWRLSRLMFRTQTLWLTDAQTQSEKKAEKEREREEEDEEGEEGGGRDRLLWASNDRSSDCLVCI